MRPLWKATLFSYHASFFLLYSTATSVAENWNGPTRPLSRFLSPELLRPMPKQLVLAPEGYYDDELSYEHDEPWSSSQSMYNFNHSRFPGVLTSLGKDQASTCYCPEDSPHSAKEQGYWGCCTLETHDYCSASEHCLPGDYCFIYDEKARCCPQGISCIQINGELLLEQTVYWYQEVHTLITSRYLEHSVMGTPTRLTVTASYPKEASSSYSLLSWSVRNAAKTLPPLDQLTTRTASMPRDSVLTSSAP